MSRTCLRLLLPQTRMLRVFLGDVEFKIRRTTTIKSENVRPKRLPPPNAFVPVGCPPAPDAFALFALLDEVFPNSEGPPVPVVLKGVGLLVNDEKPPFRGSDMAVEKQVLILSLALALAGVKVKVEFQESSVDASLTRDEMIDILNFKQPLTQVIFHKY